MALALVDCESFYASCERIFRPDLKHVPIVVLSNNDGCVIARSAEAKKMGIGMGVPWFKVKDSFLSQGRREKALPSRRGPVAGELPRFAKAPLA